MNRFFHKEKRSCAMTPKIKNFPKVHIYAVLGYGTWIKGTYAEYLLCALRMMRNLVRYYNHERIVGRDYRKVVPVFLGGKTNLKTNPHTSEARAMYDYLCKLEDGDPTEFDFVKDTWKPILEEESITTNQNLQFLFKKLREAHFQGSRLTIQCDDCRSFKVDLLWRFISKLKADIVPFDITRDMKEKLKQYAFKTPLDIAGYFIPWLEQFELDYRRKIIAIS